MNIKISTKVASDYLYVYDNFSLELFSKLNPPLLKVEIKSFEGSNKGDFVHIFLDFILFGQDWISEITEYQKDSEEIFFIDEGVKLPFFLAKWKHKHRIINNRSQSTIVDEIYYKTPFVFLDYLFYPVMFLQFYYRKPVYKNFFRVKKNT